MPLDNRKRAQLGIEFLISGSYWSLYYMTSGSDTLKDFLSVLSSPLSSKIDANFKNFVNRNKWFNKEKVNYLEDGIWELKVHPARMLFFFDESRVVVLTHGFIKKCQKTPRKEILKAKARKADMTGLKRD